KSEPARFRAIEREIGALQELDLAGSVLGRERDPEADPDDDLMSIDLVGLAQRRLQPLRQDDRVLPLIALLRLQDCELVAAKAGSLVAAQRRAAQPAGDGLE